MIAKLLLLILLLLLFTIIIIIIIINIIIIEKKKKKKKEELYRSAGRRSQIRVKKGGWRRGTCEGHRGIASGLQMNQRAQPAEIGRKGCSQNLHLLKN